MNWVGGSGRRRKRGGERRDTKPFIVRGTGAHGGAGLRRLGGGSSGASKHTMTATAPSLTSSSSFRGVLKPKHSHSQSSDMVALELLSATSKYSFGNSGRSHVSHRDASSSSGRWSTDKDNDGRGLDMDKYASKFMQLSDGEDDAYAHYETHSYDAPAVGSGGRPSTKSTKRERERERKHTRRDHYGDDDDDDDDRYYDRHNRRRSHNHRNDGHNGDDDDDDVGAHDDDGDDDFATHARTRLNNGKSGIASSSSSWYNGGYSSPHSDSPTHAPAAPRRDEFRSDTPPWRARSMPMTQSTLIPRESSASSVVTATFGRATKSSLRNSTTISTGASAGSSRGNGLDSTPPSIITSSRAPHMHAPSTALPTAAKETDHPTTPPAAVTPSESPVATVQDTPQDDMRWLSFLCVSGHPQQPASQQMHQMTTAGPGKHDVEASCGAPLSVEAGSPLPSSHLTEQTSPPSTPRKMKPTEVDATTPIDGSSPAHHPMGAARSLNVSTTPIATPPRILVDVGVQVSPSLWMAGTSDVALQTESPVVNASIDVVDCDNTITFSGGSSSSSRDSIVDSPAASGASINSINTTTAEPPTATAGTTTAVSIDANTEVGTQDVPLNADPNDHGASRNPESGTRAASWPGTPIARSSATRAGRKFAATSKSWPSTPTEVSYTGLAQDDDKAWLSFLHIGGQQPPETTNVPLDAAGATSLSPPTTGGTTAASMSPMALDGARDTASLAAADAADAREFGAFGVRHRATLVCPTMHAHFASWSLSDEPAECSS